MPPAAIATATATRPAPKAPLVLNFKEDTLTTVSRPTLRALAKRLGFNETQTVLYAVARLREEVLGEGGTEGDDIKPLTKLQHAAIAKAAPKVRGKVLGTLRF